jgi:hypothetical protein
MELSQHWFLEVKLEKKAKCGSPICTKNSRTIKLSKRALMCKGINKSYWLIRISQLVLTNTTMIILQYIYKNYINH